MKIIVSVAIMPDDHLDESERNKVITQEYIIDQLELPLTHHPSSYCNTIMRELLDNVGYEAKLYIREVV